MKTCPCLSPILTVEGSDVRCQFCGSAPREDLGGTDDLARIRYRARLNQLRESVKPTAVLSVPSRSQYRRIEMQKRRKRARELKAEGFSDGQIAIKLGVSKKTIQTDLNPGYAAAQLESNRRSRSTPEAKEHKRAYMGLWRENNRELNLQIVRECKRRAAA